jgi:hypothetical protein
MQASRNLAAIVTALAIAGCTTHAVGVTPGPPAAAATPTPTPAPTPTPTPTPGDRLFDEITRALLRGDHREAAAVVERARRIAPPAQPSADLIAYLDATVHAYQGDYRGAAGVMNAYIAKVGPTAKAAFAFHDAMIALRTADGDLLGALVECEEMTRAGMQGTWTTDDPDRMTLVRLKEHWHRAYLLRMMAQTLTGAEREAFLDYAEHARRDYAVLAAPLAGLGDSIAVLDAYFAFCDGVPDRMRAAAQRVHVAEDDDAEDLYLVQLALDGAGDSAAAAAVRARIRAQTSVNVLEPVFLAWMRADEAAVGGASPAFSPKHPTGARRAD